MHVQAAGYTVCNLGDSAHEVNTLHLHLRLTLHRVKMSYEEHAIISHFSFLLPRATSVAISKHQDKTSEILEGKGENCILLLLMVLLSSF